jgi:hypothetical protein
VHGALLAAALLGAAAHHAHAQPVRTVRGYHVTADVTMRIYVPAGRLRLVTWNRDSVDVTGTTSARTTVFGGGSNTHVKFGVEPATPGDTVLPRVDWTVTVPRAARVWVKMIDGSIETTGTTGELELYTVRGQITVQQAAGVTSIESIDAPVTVRGARGDLRIRGGAGLTTISDVRGTMSVATVSGAVTLDSVVADARIETIGGAVTMRGGSLAGNAIDIQTHAGAIMLHLDPASAPRLDLSSRAGQVLGDRITGSDKQGQITARSFKGRITVHATTPAMKKR